MLRGPASADEANRIFIALGPYRAAGGIEGKIEALVAILIAQLRSRAMTALAKLATLIELFADGSANAGAS